MNDHIILTKNYFIKKKVWGYGYIKYSTIKRMIKHITKLERTYLIRKIFLTLVEDKFFIKKQNGNIRSYLYKMKNPNQPNIKKKTIIINFA